MNCRNCVCLEGHSAIAGTISGMAGDADSAP